MRRSTRLICTECRRLVGPAKHSERGTWSQSRMPSREQQMKGKRFACDRRRAGQPSSLSTSIDESLLEISREYLLTPLIPLTSSHKAVRFSSIKFVCEKVLHLTSHLVRSSRGIINTPFPRMKNASIFKTASICFSPSPERYPDGCRHRWRITQWTNHHGCKMRSKELLPQVSREEMLRRNVRLRLTMGTREFAVC